MLIKSSYTPLGFAKWVRKVLNDANGVDSDGVFGNQCVDVPKDYTETVLYPKLSAYEVGIHGNGKDIYKNAKLDYFIKVPYSISRRLCWAQRGDIICWGATATNKYGHTAVVVSRKLFNRHSFTVVEQNGFNPDGKAYKVKRTYKNMVGIVRHK
jgi:hypothetical protein